MPDRPPSKEPQALTPQALAQVQDGPRQLEAYIQEQNASEQFICKRTATGLNGTESMHQYITKWDDSYAHLGDNSGKQ
ncbi:MAG: hypothetical protein M1812_006550 [Candelaria pacifica]|nr:MAG: hypothetical protein M1812_006550 [Candelaria pacifica]